MRFFGWNGHVPRRLCVAATEDPSQDATLLCHRGSSHDAFAQSDVCTGSKPFREVAQDAIHTMATLCRMRGEFLRGDRGWSDTPADARRR
jgi:hypothetical protein